MRRLKPHDRVGHVLAGEIIFEAFISGIKTDPALKEFELTKDNGEIGYADEGRLVLMPAHKASKK